MFYNFVNGPGVERKLATLVLFVWLIDRRISQLASVATHFYDVMFT